MKKIKKKKFRRWESNFKTTCILKIKTYWFKFAKCSSRSRKLERLVTVFKNRHKIFGKSFLQRFCWHENKWSNSKKNTLLDKEWLCFFSYAFKGATKSYFMLYSCVANILFNTVLCKPVFSAYSFKNKLFVFLSFCFVFLKLFTTFV